MRSSATHKAHRFTLAFAMPAVSMLVFGCDGSRSDDPVSGEVRNLQDVLNEEQGETERTRLELGAQRHTQAQGDPHAEPHGPDVGPDDGEIPCWDVVYADGTCQLTWTDAGVTTNGSWSNNNLSESECNNLEVAAAATVDGHC